MLTKSRINRFWVENTSEFDEASQAIIDALSSGNPIPSTAYQECFSVYSDHLHGLAEELLANLGTDNLDIAAKEAVQRFHWHMAFGGFLKHLDSGREQPFSEVARGAMQDICAALSTHPSCDGYCS